MNSSLRKRIAKRVVWSMNMKEDETLSIVGGVHSQDLIEEIALLAMEQGVHAHIATDSDNFTKARYDRVPVKYLKRASKLSLKMVEATDNRIRVESPKDPRILEKIPQKKIAANMEGIRPVRKLLDKRNVKWCLLGYPTKEMTLQLGISFSLLKRFVFDGILVDYQTLLEKSKVIAARLKGAKSAHIYDEYGTDLTLKLVNRKVILGDGLISDDDIKSGDVGLNLPEGEVYTTPLETAGSGVLFSPMRRDFLTEKVISGIRMVFENGKLNLKKTTAEKNEGLLKKSISECIKIDRKNERIIRTTNFAELGIGMNPVIDRIIGYLLTDEKIGGTIHVAIGHNNSKSYGGKNSSCLHWDFVTNKGVNLEAIYANGKTNMVIGDGKVCKN